jgi:hypothetical protein
VNLALFAFIGVFGDLVGWVRVCVAAKNLADHAAGVARCAGGSVLSAGARDRSEITANTLRHGDGTDGRNPLCVGWGTPPRDRLFWTAKAGLIRDALWQAGWENGNGMAFRKWAEQWWFDTSAKALGQNYRGFTQPLGIVADHPKCTT